MNTETTASQPLRFISVRDAAAELAVSDQLLWKLIRNGKFPARIVKIGSLIRIDRKSWETFLESSSEFVSSKRGRPRKIAPPLDMENIRSMSM